MKLRIRRKRKPIPGILIYLRVDDTKLALVNMDIYSALIMQKFGGDQEIGNNLFIRFTEDYYHVSDIRPNISD